MVGCELCQGVQDLAEGDPVDVADPICVVHIGQSLQLQSQRVRIGGRAHAGRVFEPAGDMRVVDQRPTDYLQSHPF